MEKNPLLFSSQTTHLDVTDVDARDLVQDGNLQALRQEGPPFAASA